MPAFLNLCLDRFWSPRGGAELFLSETVPAGVHENRLGDGSSVGVGPRVRLCILRLDIPGK
jgi:hypothetical protein